MWQTVGVLFALWATYYTVVFLYHSYKLRKFGGPFAFPVVGNLYTAEAFQVCDGEASLSLMFTMGAIVFGSFDFMKYPHFPLSR